MANGTSSKIFLHELGLYTIKVQGDIKVINRLAKFYVIPVVRKAADIG
jgi:hypothetical protein